MKIQISHMTELLIGFLHMTHEIFQVEDPEIIIEITPILALDQIPIQIIITMVTEILKTILY
jgi:hypothetical protein